ncbi:hypothetical protein QJS83_03315 [Bdellovibrio sp. 22V]|uniref:hypothetical protein n=1 Tax=Bdellovibrio sp. 22V TaxID=3044166 RepID=UPI002543DB76|nr:hypothetical protein [Bdellovibrio sp. 22V]WII72899.1 hypothetical protein QJS83_03315 [Bdellovibrio sp. 22V]
MKKFVQALVIWMSFFSGACTAVPGYHVSEYGDIKIEDPPEDLKVPTQAWNLMEFKVAENADDHGGGGGVSQNNLIFSEVAVFLVEKNKGIVEGQALRISLPRGGGEVDLSRFIKDQRGSFYVGFEFPEFENATAKKVIFVSHARKRRIGNQVFGAGCNQFFDISEKFFTQMKGEGIKVNTTQNRHLSVLGGTFFFAAQKDKDIHLAQVTFKSSQHAPLFCEE